MDKKLLHQFVQGTISDEDLGTVVEWLDSDPSNVEECRALQKLHDITIVSRVAREELFTSRRSTKLRKLYVELAKVAAVAATVIGIGHLISVVKSPPQEPVELLTVSVPAGQRVEVELPDKTHVWVNAKSTLTYPVNLGAGKREVALDGEAFFDVEADPEHPFLVKTSGANLVVTGTEFNVASYSGSGVLSVALLEGKVSLQSVHDGSLLYTMNPNERAVLSDGRLDVSAIKYPDYFRWREGLICFNNETVGDIVKKLELYYDVKIDVQRPDLLQRRYSGKFRTKAGVEQVLRTLQLEHKFQYVKDEENNLIVIK